MAGRQCFSEGCEGKLEAVMSAGRSGYRWDEDEWQCDVCNGRFIKRTEWRPTTEHVVKRLRRHEVIWYSKVRIG